VQGQHEVGPVLVGLVDEAEHGLYSRLIGLSVPGHRVQHELERPVRQGSEQGFARREMAVDGSVSARDRPAQWRSGNV